jgi:tRNA-splicing ligase RtcB
MKEGVEITGHDLVGLGVEPGPEFARALSFARSELARGLGWEEVSRKVVDKFIHPRVELLSLGAEKSVSVAAAPSSEEEENNVSVSLARIKELTRSPVVKSAALMPDTCPSGSGWGEIPVGGVVVTGNEVIPAAHSADVNCGMSATFFESARPLSSLMEALRSSTVFGPFPTPRGQENRSDVLSEPVWSNPFLKGLESEALRYLGTQGDGNHFSYLGQLAVSSVLVDRLAQSGHEKLARQLKPAVGKKIWALVTHHGSRNFGAKVYRRGLEAAVKYTATVASGIPKAAAWLDLGTKIGADYWGALQYISRWTEENHAVIHRKFISAVGSLPVANISNHHNAVWKREDGVYHGKGATPAWKVGGISQLGIIPLNMGREILLVEGLDNSKFLSFAPHGAGRNRSRSATKKEFIDPATGKISMDKVNQSVTEQAPGIEIVWASGLADISETPVGYKSASKVKEEIESHGLARIIAEISPRGCMMAGDFGETWKSRSRSKDIAKSQCQGFAGLRPPQATLTPPPSTRHRPDHQVH